MTDADASLQLHPALYPLLDHMRKIDASDLYLAGNAPPVFRVNDVTYPGRVALASDEVAAMADSFLSAVQRDALYADLELNLAVRLDGDARFRVNFHFQSGTPAMVIRALPIRIHSLDELGLPAALKQIACARRGLIVIAGESAAARAAIFNALIDHRNASEAGHILTVEDPIEFQHSPKQSIITQREIGRDTHSYYDALRNALRQAADLIALDEIRDAESLDAILNFAETGHACIASVYASSAAQAIERILGLFPEPRHSHLRLRLARGVRALIAERVVPTVQGGRALAVQIATDTPAIKQAIARGELDSLDVQVEQAKDAGCCSFESSLLELTLGGRVHEAEALRVAPDPVSFQAKLDQRRAAATPGAAPVADSLVLRLAPDPYDMPVAAAAPVPAAERRTKAGPARG